MISSPLTKTIFLLLSVFPALLVGQFIIENPGGAIGTSPIAQDVNVCFPQGSTLAFRVIATADVTDPVLRVELAPGRIFGGTIQITDANGTFSLGPNIGTPEEPEFQLTGDFMPGSFARIRMSVAANCGAINVNGATHTVEIGGEREVSTTHDALFLTLSIGNLSAETIGVGQSGTVSGTIIGGGNGCAEEVVFRLYDAPGVTTTELRVGGTVIVADSVVGLNRYYSLGPAEITQSGDGDVCFEALEMLDFERDVDVTSCEVDAGYEASWGCFGATCITTGEVAQQINIPAGVPNVQITSRRVIRTTNLCPDSSAIVEFTLTNNGTGVGTAFNFTPFSSTDANFFVSSFRQGQSFTNLVIDSLGTFVPVASTGGVPASSSASLPTLYADFSGATTDPDGPGGLDDLDGDGQFDDLPVGESITLRLDWNHLCQDDTRSCGVFHVGSPGIQSLYDNQCGEQIIGNYASINGFGYTSRTWTSSVTGPGEIDDAIPFNVRYNWSADFNGDASTLVDCPDGYLRNVITLPPDVSYVPGSAVYDRGPTVSDEVVVRDSIVPTGDTLILDVNRTGNGSSRNNAGFFEIELILNCGGGGAKNFAIKQYFICDESCNTCLEELTCQNFTTNANCPGACDVGGMVVVASPGFLRTTTGFTDSDGTARVDATSLPDFQRQFGMPCDTFIATFNGINRPDSAGVYRDNASFVLEYPQLGGGNLLEPQPSTVSIFNNGALQQTCTVAPTDVIVGGTHQITYDFAVCGYTFGVGDSVSIATKLSIAKNNGLSSVPTQVGGLRSFFASVNPNGETVTCNDRNPDLYLHRPVETYRSSLGNYGRTGCGEYNMNLAIMWPRGPFDPYPGEVRPYSRVDT
ncbi:MAG: hypothetical protein AAF597_05855, partial [Bacteroidota bacterium]